ncbi:MAG: SurA N-terminal domain-containing protein [Rhizobiaceae bacterium]
MLEGLRSFISGWVAKLLLVLLIGSFALWGVSGSILGGTDTSAIARVGETTVGVREFLSAYNSNMNEMQQSAGRRLTREEGRVFGVESRTMNRVVFFATMNEFAREQNMSLSDKMLAKLIAENPAFHDSTGKFSRTNFQNAVANAQMRESDFITSQNKTATRSQVTRAFATGKLLPDAFKHAMGEYIQEQRKFSYITITSALAGEPDAATDAQLKTYFDANKKIYKAPEYRKLVILAVEPKDIADEKAISTEAVAADYQDRLASYSIPEQRRVQQIVFKSQEDAEAAVKSIADGAVFETILSEQKIKTTDADLGLLSKAQMPKAIQEAAFKLALNTPSEILKGAFGPSMIRITEIADAKITLFEDVQDEIRKDLALRAAADEIVSMQETIEDMRAGGATIATAAEKLGLKTRVIAAIDRTAQAPDGTIVKDVPSSNKLLAQAFTIEVGSQSSPLDLGEAGYVWVDVEKITPTRDQTLEEVKTRVSADWLAAEKATTVSKKANALKAQLGKGATLATIAEELKTTTTTTALLKRSVAEGNFSKAANLAGFGGNAKHIAIVDGPKAGEKILITVSEIKRSEAQIVAAPDAEMKIANEGAADDLITQLIRNLQSGYSVTQNPTLINQTLSYNR